MAPTASEDLLPNKIRKKPERMDDVYLVNPKGRCQYGQICGGCPWIEFSPKQQYQQKLGLIRSFIKDIDPNFDNKSLTLTTMTEPWQYRSRVLLRGSIDGTGKVEIGFFASGSRQQINIHQCEVAHKSINQFIAHIHQIITVSEPQRFRIEIQHLPTFANGSRDIVAIVHPLGHQTCDDLIKQLHQFFRCLWVGDYRELKQTIMIQFEASSGINWHTAPGIFQQINRSMNRNLLDTILSWTHPDPKLRICDLYCGSGNLSLPLAKQGHWVTGFDVNPRAIEVARYNASQNRIETSQFHHLGAIKALKRLSRDQQEFDILILDPPRKGLAESAENILDLNCHRILYCSCQPQTLTKDLEVLTQDFTLESVQCFDFFPQTPHFETLVDLRRKT
jgi:23S rRNA (uracil1939-C5)-methyltransferase